MLFCPVGFLWFRPVASIRQVVGLCSGSLALPPKGQACPPWALVSVESNRLSGAAEGPLRPSLCQVLFPELSPSPGEESSCSVHLGAWPPPPQKDPERQLTMPALDGQHLVYESSRLASSGISQHPAGQFYWRLSQAAQVGLGDHVCLDRQDMETVGLVFSGHF